MHFAELISMINAKQNPYNFLDTYCLRTPFFSLKFYNQLIRKKEFSLDDLKKYWKEPAFKEGLFLASPELYSEIEKTLKGSYNQKKIKSICQTVFKYLIRASTRCTPFGLFSQVSLKTIDNSNEETTSFTRRTDFDTNYLFSLALKLSRIDEIKNQLLFFPNTSLYKTDNDQYRYVEYFIEKNTRSYSIEAIEATEYLDIIIKESEKGKTIHQLANYLIDDDISYEEAKGYIEILIDNQILISELYPNVTGNDILSELICTLEKYDNLEHHIEKLKSLQNDLNCIDQKLGNSHFVYEDIIQKLQKLSIPFEGKHLFQTDLSVEKQIASITTYQVNTIKKVIPLLLKLNQFTESDHLKKFKKAFIDRYDQQEVDLANVLDIESGIGYVQNNEVADTTPFLYDIKPSKKNVVQSEQFLLNEAQKIIYQKLLQAHKNNDYGIEITDTDFKNIELNWKHIPDTMAAFTEVVHQKDKQQIILHGFSHGAGKLLGRFCHFNKNIFNYVTRITDIEQDLNSDKTLAEIVHLPQSRTGNILKRPHIRSYEIPYITNSTLPFKNQISINDLTVSIRNNRVVLKSKRLGKEVLPRLTNAHNYSSKALPIYHFLCDLEFQNTKTYLGFNWPNITKQFSFLPRVSYRGIVLSKAKWIIHKDAIDEIVNKYDTTNNPIDCIKQWRKKHGIPKFIQIKEGDNTLLIDLSHTESIQLFVDIIKRKNNMVLQEFLHINDDYSTSNEKENYVNEHIFTFYNTQKLNSKKL